MVGECIVAAFLRCEAYLSPKPNWRLYAQFLEALLGLARLVSPSLVRRIIVPRLLGRLTTTVSRGLFVYSAGISIECSNCRCFSLLFL